MISVPLLSAVRRPVNPHAITDLRRSEASEESLDGEGFNNRVDSSCNRRRYQSVFLSWFSTIGPPRDDFPDLLARGACNTFSCSP